MAAINNIASNSICGEATNQISAYRLPMARSSQATGMVGGASMVIASTCGSVPKWVSATGACSSIVR